MSRIWALVTPLLPLILFQDTTASHLEDYKSLLAGFFASTLPVYCLVFSQSKPIENKTDFVSPLLKTFQNSPLQSRNQFLMAYKATSNGLQGPRHNVLLLSSHISLLAISQTCRQTAISGSWQLLFSLLARLFPRMSGWFSSPLQVFLKCHPTPCPIFCFIFSRTPTTPLHTLCFIYFTISVLLQEHSMKAGSFVFCLMLYLQHLK